MRISKVLLGLLVLLCCSCDKNSSELHEDYTDGYEESPKDTTFSNFQLVDVNGREYSPFLVTDDELYYTVPFDIDLSSIIPISSNESDSLAVGETKFAFDGRSVDFSDFTNQIVFISNRGSSAAKSYKVFICDLPVLQIDTPDSLPIESKTERKEGCVVKLVTSEGECDLGTAGIRGRGNSSWLEPKKPYNIKLDKKASILDLDKSKHWVLLANAKYDRTQLHNATAFEIARHTDYPWVQSGRYVELIINGTFQGLYFLCEKIRIEKGKIDIEIDNNTERLEDCAYLLESYVVYEEDPDKVTMPLGFFQTGVFNRTGDYRAPCTLAWEIKEPENINKAQEEYIINNLIALESLIRDSIESGRYRDYFDIDTAIDWWLTEELCVNEEASRTKNVYLYKKGKDGKFCVGPLWDIDAWSFGTYGLEVFWAKDNSLYFNMLFKDPVFIKRVKEKWNKYKKVWSEQIPNYIDEQYHTIYRSAKRNEMIWPDWIVPASSYEQSVQEMKEAFVTQLNWMDEQINNM